MKKLFTLLTATSLFAACGKSPKKEVISKKAINQIVKDDKLISAKLVTDGGSIDDKSFNQTMWEGVKRFTGAGEQYYVIPSADNSQDRQTLYSRILKDAQLMVVGGYQHKEAITEFQKNMPENRGIIYLDGVVASPAVNSIVFDTEEIAFYAGYLTAQYLSRNVTEFDKKDSEGLKVGTYGGMNFEAVTAFMGGFQQGVQYWNDNLKDGDKKVEFIKLGSSKDSYFSGNFRPGSGKALSEKLINKGADVILPVAGPQTLDTLAAIKEKQAHTLVIGVDTDQVLQYTEHSDKFLTSILKKMDIASERAIKHALGVVSNSDYGLGKTTVGTVSNNLLDLAFDGDNILLKNDYELVKEDQKISTAAKKATKKFEA